MLVKLYGNYSLSYLKEWVNFGDTAKCVYKAQVKHVEDIRLTSFFLNLFHFRRFEVIQRRIVIQILPFCCFFLALAVSSCRSFLICLPVYTPCHWVQSHQSNCPKSCFDHITPLPKGWHQRQSGPHLPSQPNLPFPSAPHSRQSGPLIVLCSSASPDLDSYDALWQEYTVFPSHQPFKTIPILHCPAHDPFYFFDYSSCKWSLFPLCVSGCNRVISAGTYYRLLCI